LQQLSVGGITLAGNNTTFTGQINIGSSQFTIANSNAFNNNTIISNGGTLNIAPGVTLEGLTITGNIHLATDIETTGNIVFDGDVVVLKNSSSTTSRTVALSDTDNYVFNQYTDALLIDTGDNNISFNGTITASSNSKGNNRSLNIDAGAGEVTFNDRIGYAFNGQPYNESLIDTNLVQLEVTAETINLNADIMTFEEQIFNGDIVVGDNGANGNVRTLLSIDPLVHINGKVDDTADVPTHSLIQQAIEIDRTGGAGLRTPVVNVSDEIGSIRALLAYETRTGIQNNAVDAEWTDLELNTQGDSYYRLEKQAADWRLRDVDQSGYVDPRVSATNLNNAQSIMSFLNKSFRHFVKEYLNSYRSSSVSPTVSVGAKINDSGFNKGKDNTQNQTDAIQNQGGNASEKQDCEVAIKEDCNN
jgi:hypothetical protein